jgi:hypothetical protein
MVGIWLALGLISLASCAPTSTQVAAQNKGLAPVGSAAAAQPETHFAPNAPVDSPQSTALTNYLHSRQLPLVGGRVLASNGGPRQAILYGYVATPFGKADAVDKAREFLNDSGAQVDNRIKIEPDLAGPTGNPNGATAENNPDLNNPDIQKYEDQQNQQLSRQQQQYMNQGSSMGGGAGPMSLLLPLLMMGGGFGVGGGGGSGFSFGGGSFGGPVGSPYGYPSSPPPGYGSPYGP